jgi:peptidoglycan-associated lipoprotein
MAMFTRISRKKRRTFPIGGNLYAATLMLSILCLMMGCGTSNYAGVATSKSPDFEKVSPPPVHSLETLVSESPSLEDPNPTPKKEGILEERTPPFVAQLQEFEIEPIQEPTKREDSHNLLLSEKKEGKVSTPQSPQQLVDVYFDYDQAIIRPDAQARLEANVRFWQTRLSNASIMVEGHCDERGSLEYNLVLGQRRAETVKAYLVDLGVPASKIQTVSFGKEKPVCIEQKESCWQRNRRTHFIPQ